MAFNPNTQMNKTWQHDIQFLCHVSKKCHNEHKQRTATATDKDKTNMQRHTHTHRQCETHAQLSAAQLIANATIKASWGRDSCNILENTKDF